MRLMEQIRRHGDKGMKAFLALMVISVFGGLGVGFVGGIGRNNAQQKPKQGAAMPVIDTKQQDVAMTVNGLKVTSDQFSQKISAYNEMMRQQSTDPQMQLYLYGQVANSYVQEEVLLGEAQRAGVKATSADISDERNKVAQQLATDEKSKTTGNALGDVFQKLGSQRERNAQFQQYLDRTGQTEPQWQADVTRQVLERKAREELQKGLDAAKDAKAKETKALIDEQLAKGVSFSDLAKQYSEAEGGSPKLGGDMVTWLKPGLLPDSKNDDVLFSTKIGEMTPWFEIDAGYQRWQVYDRKEASGPDFEKAKPDIVAKIKKDKGDSYTPTDDEIAKKYVEIKARQILLKKTDPAGVQKKVDDMVAAAQVEINNPYALAYQALYDDKLQPPAEMDYNALVKLAKDNSAAAADYDFTPIQGKLDRGKPKPLPGAAAPSDSKAADAGKTDAAAGADAAKPADAKPADAAGADASKPADSKPADAAGADAAKTDAAKTDAAKADAGKTDGAAQATTDAGKPAGADDKKAGDAAAKQDPSAPCYALAVALLKMGEQDSKGTQRGAFGQEVVATIYLDWLDHEGDLKSQPLDRDKARQEVEDLLATALKSDNYNGKLYADRGANLAWLNKPQDADAQLQQALKYVAKTDTATLGKIQATYDKLDMKDKSKEVQDKIDAARQEQLKEQIEKIRAQQDAQAKTPAGGAAAPGSSTSIPITIPPASGAPSTPATPPATPPAAPPATTPPSTPPATPPAAPPAAPPTPGGGK